MNFIFGNPTRPGPEADLVERFIENGFEKLSTDIYRFVFIEPSIASSIPDLVVVYWDFSVTKMWPKERYDLKSVDLRMAHLLFLTKSLAYEQLRDTFPRNYKKSISRLENAGLIKQSGANWQLTNVMEIFAVRRIVTFEAKISWMNKALEQAQLNMWFASESYVLTSAKRPNKKTFNRANEKGVGIWSAHEESMDHPLLKARKQQIPKSYASWLINELVWSTITMEG